MRRNSTRRLLAWGKLAVSLALIGWLVNEYAGADLTQAFSKASVFVLAIALVINFSASMVIPAVVQKAALGGRRELSLRQLLAVNLAIKFYAMVLPRGASVGIRWARYRAPLGGRPAAGLVVVELVTQILGAAAIAAIGIGIEWARLGDRAIPLALLALVLFGIGVMVIYVLLGRPRSAPITTLSQWMQRRIGINADAPSTGELNNRRLIWVVTMTVFAQLLLVISAWLVSLDLGLSLDLAAIAWMRSIISLIALVPFTVAGLGIREAGYVAFASLYGVSGEAALAFALVLLGLQLVIALLGAMLELLGVVRLRKSDAVSGDGVGRATTGGNSGRV